MDVLRIILLKVFLFHSCCFSEYAHPASSLKIVICLLYLFQGVLEAIRISLAGYPTRRTYSEFVDRFGILAQEIIYERYQFFVLLHLMHFNLNTEFVNYILWIFLDQVWRKDPDRENYKETKAGELPSMFLFHYLPFEHNFFLRLAGQNGTSF